MSTQQAFNLDVPTVFRSLVDGRPPVGPVALVVAHPDDGVMGVGGQMERWRRHLVCVHATEAEPAVLERVGIGSDQIRAFGFPYQKLASALFDLDRAIENIVADVRRRSSSPTHSKAASRSRRSGAGPRCDVESSALATGAHAVSSSSPAPGRMRQVR
jgi:hypothetical protein